MSTPLDRQATCPNCGAPMTFRFAGARAQVCAHCRFVVARQDGNFVPIGRMADLVDIPSPLAVGATGRFNGEPFLVEGRLQLDRAGAPGAPWQETLLSFPNSGRWVWIAAAQGRFYALSEVPFDASRVPHVASLRPGRMLDLGEHGSLQVAEVGQRRVVSGEGELPNVAEPGAVTSFADVAGPNGVFGTIDYGDRRKTPATLFLGRQIDPATLVLDSGAPIEPARAEAAAIACPNCGGNLPLAAPETALRIVCRYCGMASDLERGALRALKPAPKPPVDPFIPLGAEGTLRGRRVLCIGFVIRGCTVDAERYRWREYLLYAGPRDGYFWLMEEDGAYSFVTPLGVGDVQVGGGSAVYGGSSFAWKQSVRAEVEYVVGEFYWKVEIGESVRATDYQRGVAIVSVEEAPTEVSMSLCEPLPPRELEAAFGLRAPARRAGSGCGGTIGSVLLVAAVVFVLLIVLCAVGVSGGGGSSGSGSYGGPAFGGK